VDVFVEKRVCFKVLSVWNARPVFGCRQPDVETPNMDRHLSSLGLAKGPKASAQSYSMNSHAAYMSVDSVPLVADASDWSSTTQHASYRFCRRSRYQQ